MTKNKPISIFTKQAVEEDGRGLYDSYKSLQLDEFNKVIVDENGKYITKNAPRPSQRSKLLKALR